MALQNGDLFLMRCIGCLRTSRYIYIYASYIKCIRCKKSIKCIRRMRCIKGIRCMKYISYMKRIRYIKYINSLNVLQHFNMYTKFHCDLFKAITFINTEI